MALQADTRSLLFGQNLVLFMDLKIRKDRTRIDSYLAEIYEATQKELEYFPSLPVTTDPPLFHSAGTRLRELTASLAFIDILFHTRPAKSYRKTLDTWILASKDSPANRHQICFKVRYQGILQDPMQPESRLADFTIPESSSMVLGDAQEEALRLLDTWNTCET